MKIAIFSAKPFEKPFLDSANAKAKLDLTYFDTPLTPQTAPLTEGFNAICCFVNDNLSKATLDILAQHNIQCIALRCAGFNNVDLQAAKAHNITVMRVPEYSPYAVAEFATALILALNRKVHKAYLHVKEHNFLLNGLMGFDMHGKTVGVIGTGKIGAVFCTIMKGFGCHVLAHDVYHNKTLDVEYVSLDTLFERSDIISLHCPLTPDTQHLINDKVVGQLKPGVMIVNTSRGALIDTASMIRGLKSRTIGALGLDVYEEEEHLFFKDLSDEVIPDELFLRLQSFPNVIITGHQAFFTQEAVTNITNTTVNNLESFLKGDPKNTVSS